MRARPASVTVTATLRSSSAEGPRVTRPAFTCGSAAPTRFVDHTTTDVVGAVTEPVDVLPNLAPVEPEQLAALGGLVADGGVVVNTTVWMPAPSDEARGVRGIDLYVRSDAGQLTELAARVDRGELAVDVAERVALRELPSVHARAAVGALRGKVVVVVDQA